MFTDYFCENSAIQIYNIMKLDVQNVKLYTMISYARTAVIFSSLVC